MRTGWVAVVMLAVGGLVGPTSGAVAVAVADTERDATTLQTTSTPKAFRWVPYPGVPDGTACGVRANDTGGAVVALAGSQHPGSSLWVARAGGARELPMPAVKAYPATWEYGLAISAKDVVAAVFTDDGSFYNEPQRLVRWTPQGTVEVSPILPSSPPWSVSNTEIIGVTDVGDVVAVVTPWLSHGGPPSSRFMLWRADGSFTELMTDYHVGWPHRSVRMANDGSFPQSRGWSEVSKLVRPRTGWQGVTTTPLAYPVASRSPDGQWWVSGGPYGSIATAKGMNAPPVPVPAELLPSGGTYVLGINNQGTLLIKGDETPLRWIHGTRWIDVTTHVTRLPQGAVVNDGSGPGIDSAGRIATSINRAGRCRAGVLAPEW